MRLFLLRSAVTGTWQVHRIIGVQVETLASCETEAEARAFQMGYSSAKSYYDLTGKLITPLRENHKLKNGFLISKRALGGVAFLNPGSAD